MIVTIVNCAPPRVGAAVAENLALLRARMARKVLLLDAGPGQDCERWGVERARAHLLPAIAVRPLHGPGCAARLERLLPDYDEIVIATDGCGSHECRWALIAAHVAVVPLALDYADIDAHYDCIARLNSARMFNPGLRVLFVPMAGERDPAPDELGAVRAYAAQVMAAGLAGATVHLPALAWGDDAPGRCVCDIANSTGAAEMAALHGEVFRAGRTRALPQAVFRPGLNT
ncbi:hypothetical protein [Massilia sp. Root335]|uniref:hypothetical protein n=1 Tax=Massilia sp. Root335 TaxID=1736517 RepID=UPI000700D4BA|nr:hypothetical protein [Massilia sp. Root335]KQV45125.1 hypothetical protein ASC93_00795 [Massilia sp. Root335]